MFILKFLRKFVRWISPDPVETYLANAVDLCDLEYRLRKIERGYAP